MRITQRSVWSRALALALLALAAATAWAWATTVSPRNTVFDATNTTAVNIVTNSTLPATISCTGARISDKVPNERSNGNPGGSVVTQVPNTPSTYVATFSGCTRTGGGALSGGPASSAIVFGFNVLPVPGGGTRDIVAASLPRSAFHFYDTTGCEITIGRFETQAMVGTWTDGVGAPSVMTFTSQNLYADATSNCRWAPFTQVEFTGTFNVNVTGSLSPVIVGTP